MISAYLPPRRPVVPITFLLGLTIAGELALSYGSASSASNMLCDLALIAVFVAASERRHKAMLAAAGIACGLTVYGAMLLPLAIGLTISRRVAPRTLLLVPLFVCSEIIVLGMLPLPIGSVGLWSVVPQREMTALLAAAALGGLTWLTTRLSARPLMPDMMPSAALTCALGYALVMPAASMAIPLALAHRCEDRRILLLTALALLMTVLALSMPATLTVAAALALAAKPFLARAANDNPVFERKSQFVTPA